jgi:trigger factor
MKAGCLRAAPHTSIPPLHEAAERANLEGIILSSTEMIETTPQSAGASTATEEPDEHDGHEHSHSAATLNPDCTREVEIEIPADEVSRNFRTVTKRYQKNARIPGFRSGKVPESLIRGRFAEQIRQDVMEAVLPDHFRTAIAERQLKPISQPQVTGIELEEGKPLRFKAAFEVVPEFSIDGYQDVKVEKVATELTDAEVDAELARIRDSRSTMEPVTEERALTDGDFAQISFTGVVQPAETESEAPPATQQPITGQDVMVQVGGPNTLDSFNAALRGASVGQQLKFEVSYPQDFGERQLAGKRVAYDLEIKGIKKKIEPELNDDFAKELGQYESLADFTRQLREHMANDKQRRVQSETTNRLIDALVNRFEFPIPESLVQQQIDARLDRGLRALAAQGMRTEDMRNLDFDRLRAAQRPSATAEVKGSLLLDRIADAENVSVPEEDVERELQAISLQMREPVDALRPRLTEDGSLARIRERLRREKISALLYERLAS